MGRDEDRSAGGAVPLRDGGVWGGVVRARARARGRARAVVGCPA